MQELRRARFELSGAPLLAGAFVGACALAAVLIGAAPLTASIVTIFLFAGLHNAFEFRYFLARMPVRWGKSGLYYGVAIGVVAALTAGYLAVYFAGGRWLRSAAGWTATVAGWNTLLVFWLALLVYLRGRGRPRADWSWAFPAACGLAALVWLVPAHWSLALVYLHPLVALWFLERQMRRTKKEWLGAYRFCLATLPFFILILYFSFAASPALPDETDLFRRIAQHAGRDLLPGVSSRFLVAAHVFLETVHYAAWIVLIPLVDRRAVPWKLAEIPLYARDGGRPKLVAAACLVSALLVVALWSGFALDYAAARDVYFVFAIAHVLAEFPFLIKML